MDEPTSKLTAAIASGDTEAFARFYRAWFDSMLAEARRATGRDEAFCLDVVHDAMLRVIRSMKTLDSEPRLRSWLRLVIRSCAFDRLRRDGRRQAREQAIGRSAAANAPGPPSEQLAWLLAEIAALDESSARLMIMRHRFGWSLQRIGEAVGVSAAAVDGRLRRIAAALRRRRPKELTDER